MKKRIIALLMAVAVSAMTCLTACTADEKKTKENEKIQLVFEYQKDRISTDFEEVLESKFDVDIIMVENQSTDPRLRLTNEVTHDMAPDFVLCEYMRNIDKDILSEYFYDLSKEGFVNNYYLQALQSCTAEDGKLYYIPGPSYVYGIIYDRTMFEELGLEVPHNYTEFTELIKTVDAMKLTGTEPDDNDPDKTVEVPIEAFVPTMRWCDMSALVFNTFNYNDTFVGVTNTKWLSDYQQGEGSMTGHMEPAAEKYLQLFEDGFLKESFFTTEPGYRSRKLYQYHTSLMTIESQQGYAYNKQINEDDPENIHELGIMPIYTSDEPDSGYLYAIPRSFIAVSKQGASDEKKLGALMEVMSYLSTTEGQKLLIAGDDYFGFLKEDTSLESDFYTEVIDTINAGRIISNFYFEGDNHGDSVETFMHDATPDLLNGNITVEEWLLGADAARDKALEPKSEPVVYGEAKETLSPLQTAYVCGLAYLNSMDADVALVPVSGYYGTQAYFYSGDITDDIIKLITTENLYFTSNDAGMMNYAVAEMTGEELLTIAANGKDSSMTAIAGAEMTYAMSKENGEQYVSVKINGEELDPNRTYRVASMKGVLGKAEIVKEYDELNFIDMFIAYLESQGGIIEAPTELEITE
ncbi:MAG: 5'-nucleotidase C-terminal domain-containing protein [Clostridia bacterium]|nr:5'-nucleotidase C-terminal domain-containing protein [Clostridia bacterium]